jgi:hypothetical protein
MTDPLDEAQQRCAEWALDVVSALPAVPDHAAALSTLEFLLQRVGVHLTMERGADFASAFQEAARQVMSERFPLLGQTRH